MVDFSESNKMIKISVKVNKSNNYDGSRDNISFLSSSLNKERNIVLNPQ